MRIKPGIKHPGIKLVKINLTLFVWFGVLLDQNYQNYPNSIKTNQI